MSVLALKVKTKDSQQVIKSLTENNTIGDLKVLLNSISNIAVQNLQVKIGFPPKILSLEDESLDLKAAGVKSGDTLIVEEVSGASEPNKPQGNPMGSQNLGVLMKKIVPADNSCLFTSFYFALNGRLEKAEEGALYLRDLIASTVSQDPETFSEAFLGKPNSDYCSWIKNKDTWGGAIEISILSKHYGIEIVVVDAGNAILNRFGEDQEYGSRIFLFFDGIHYDPLYYSLPDGTILNTIFDSKETDLLLLAEEMAKEAQQSRQFTNVDKFTIRCMVCNAQLTGQTEAQQHAKTTGHTNFGEI